MTYVVYGASGSGSMPVEAALTLMNQPFRVVEAVTWEGDAERDKVAAVNPMRQIPALGHPARRDDHRKRGHPAVADRTASGRGAGPAGR